MNWDLIRESNLTILLLLEQAKVHDSQPCCGLPFCASCRAAVLLKNDLNTAVSEAWVNTQPEGTVVRWGHLSVE